MQAFELSILDWIQTHCRTEFLDRILPIVSDLCAHGEIWILLAVVFLLTKKYRKIGMVLALALLLDVLSCNVILKPLVARPRPYNFNHELILLVSKPTDWSFPSGHTAASFAAVGALLAEKSDFVKPAFLLAAAIAFSRLYLYVHWPSDVLAGAGLGVAVGYLASYMVERLYKLKTGQLRS